MASLSPKPTMKEKPSVKRKNVAMRVPNKALSLKETAIMVNIAINSTHPMTLSIHRRLMPTEIWLRFASTATILTMTSFLQFLGSKEIHFPWDAIMIFGFSA